MPEYVSVKPKLSDFGYDEQSYLADKEKHKKEIELNERQHLIVLAITALVAWVVVFSILYNGKSSIWQLLGLVYISALIAYVSAAFVVGILSVIFSSFFGKNHNLKYANILEYDRKLFAYNYWQKRAEHEFWTSLSGLDFERELAKLFKVSGYKVQLTKASGDKGVDIFLQDNDKIIVVQCKAHKKAVGPSTVRDLYGTMMDSNADEAILASINGFTSGVYEFVKDKNIHLWDVETIIKFKENLPSKA